MRERGGRERGGGRKRGGEREKNKKNKKEEEGKKKKKRLFIAPGQFIIITGCDAGINPIWPASEFKTNVRYQ